jgi:hypothetical protein
MNGLRAGATVREKTSTLLKDRDTLLEKARADHDEALHAKKVGQMTIAALVALDNKAQHKLNRHLEFYGDGGMTKTAYTEKRRRSVFDGTELGFRAMRGRGRPPNASQRSGANRG